MPSFLLYFFLDYGKIGKNQNRRSGVNTSQGSVTEKIIEGSMVAVGLAEAAHLYALFFHRSLSFCVRLMLLFFVCGGCAWLLYCLHGRKKASRRKDGVSLLRLLRVYPLLYLLIGGLILFQIIWNDWMHAPYLKDNITGEIVQTMLATDSLYQVNPLTGQSFEAGMPLRLQILSLPTLFAAVCRLTGLPAVTVVYRIFPMLCLLFSYLVYARFAVYFFPSERKKQALFVLFVALVYQFGCYGTAMDSFLLFFCGSQGAAFRAGVILPYAVLCCLEKRWQGVILCGLAEICVVWTLYGLGYTVLVAFVFCLLRLWSRFWERRKTK